MYECSLGENVCSVGIFNFYDFEQNKTTTCILQMQVTAGETIKN
jgi:hypothetical protein